jgi:hypothetical protein
MRLTLEQKALRRCARDHGTLTRIAIDAMRSWSREADGATNEAAAASYALSADQHAENAVRFARKAGHFALEAL